MGAATIVAARSLRTPCALDARYGQETTRKEILNTILDPSSSQTEDFAASLPEAYRAVTLLPPPALFQAGIGMTPQLQAGNCSVE
jgi:hypothetical protein